MPKVEAMLTDDPRAEIFAHENGVERHRRAVGKAEHQREAVEAREVAGEHIKADGDGLDAGPKTIMRFAPMRSAASPPMSGR